MTIILNGFKLLKSLSERLEKYKKNFQEKNVNGKKDRFYCLMEDKIKNVVFYFIVNNKIKYDNF